MFSEIKFKENYHLEIATSKINILEFNKYLTESLKDDCKTIDDYILNLKIINIINTIKINYKELKDIENIDLITLENIRNFKDSKLLNILMIFIKKNINQIIKISNKKIIVGTLGIIIKSKKIEDSVIQTLINSINTNEDQYIFIEKFKVFKSKIKNENLKKLFRDKVIFPIYFDNLYKIKNKLEVLDSYNADINFKERFDIEIIKLIQSEKYDSLDIWDKKNILENFLENKKYLTINLTIFIEKNLQLIEELFNKHLKEYGQSIKFEITIDEYIAKVKDVLEFRELFLYIDSYILKRKYISNYDRMASEQNSSLIDFVCGRNNLEYTEAFAMEMEMTIMERALIINYLIVNYKEKFWSEFKCLYTDVLKILEFNEEKNFIKNLKIGLLDHDGTCRKILGEIEWLLRYIYVQKKYQTNISNFKSLNISLNTILEKENLDGIFLPGEIKCLRYILIESSGFNYRNSTSHNNRIEELNEKDELYLISVFIFILIKVDYMYI